MTDRTVKVRLVAEHGQYRRAMAECGKDTKDVNKEVDKLDGRNVDIDTKPAQRGLAALQDSVEKSTAKILAMKAAFKETGDVGILRDLRKEEGNLRRLTGWVRSLGDESEGTSQKLGLFSRVGVSAGKGLNLFATAATDAGGAMKILAHPAGALTAALGLTAVASIAASAAVASLGLGIVGLGAAALMNSTKVKVAFTTLGSVIGDVGQRAASVLEGTFIKSLTRLGITAVSVEPSLKRMFTNVRPGVDALTIGVDGLARNAMPGLEDASEGANRVMVTLGEELPELGASVSRFGTAMGSAAGDGRLLGQALGAVSTTLDIMGPTLVTLSKTAEFASIGMNNFGGILEMVKGKHQGVDAQMPKMITNVKLLEEAYKAAGIQVQSYSDKVAGLNEVNLSTAQAQIQYQIGLNNLTGALKVNKGAWDGLSTAALQNKQIVIDQTGAAQQRLVKQYEQIKATQGEAAANQWATVTHGTMRTAIIKAAGAAGLNEAAVAALVDTIFRMPKAAATNVSAPGAPAAKKQVDAVTDAVNRLARNREATIGVNVSANAAERRLLGGGATPAEMAYAQKYHGARAVGGPVDANRSYLVGERGPERFTPRAPGYITPNHKLATTVVARGTERSSAILYDSASFLDEATRRMERRGNAALADRLAPSLGGGEGTSVRRILAAARMFYPGAVVSSGFRRGDPGYHGRGLAADIIGGGASGMARIARGFYGMSNRLLELIHSGGGGYFVKNGRRVGSGYYSSVLAGHYSHVHVAANPNALSGGGRYRAGGPRIVGEHGPELDIPDSPGYVRSRPWEGAQLTPAQLPAIHNHFYIDGREIRGITRAEIGEWQSQAGRQLAHGRR